MSKVRAGLIQAEAGIVTRDHDHRGARGVTCVVVHHVLETNVVLRLLGSYVEVNPRLNEVCIGQSRPFLLHVQWTCG